MGFAVLLAGAVLAATFIEQRKVLTCADTDGGVVTNVTGTVSGVTLVGGNYSLTDLCKTNTTLYEYACLTNANGTYYQVWSENCASLGKTCLNGRCQ